MNKRVAFLTCRALHEQDPSMGADNHEHSRELSALNEGCREIGIELTPLVWNDASAHIDAFEAAVVGTTWDYTRQPDAFIAELERIEARVPLYNSVATIRWNQDKTYLSELARRGAKTIPTVWVDHVREDNVAASFDQLDADHVVIKPVVGAGAWRQVQLRRGEQLPGLNQLPPATAMIQPFLPSVSLEGEYSFVFCDRQFSHALLKRPADGDYRVQSIYGGTDTRHEPTPAELDLAQKVLDTVEGDLLYARVDMLRGLDGKLALIELELIEPYLYPLEGRQLGPTFAKGLHRLLTHR